ncbi:hypothetical protein BC781_1011145 [Sediminitomix flava]|uniref:Uncharacterized protein n=1 Tax=Sediminitomix flava TaxID=379075 RepID=A0A315ZJA8_SEDFL|nr:hypothetical protein BC781_1011145 [Sediminitomix flava]
MWHEKLVAHYSECKKEVTANPINYMHFFTLHDDNNYL